MKIKILLIVFVSLALSVPLTAQIPNPSDLLKEKAENRAADKVDEATDKLLDKAEEGVSGLFKKKEKTEKKKEVKENNVQNEESAEVKHDDKNNLKAYSKFDFVPGDKVIFYDDFAQDAAGDFPALWNTNGSGEVVTINSSTVKWFNMKGGELCFSPEVKIPISENFTFEFNMIFTDEARSNETFKIVLLKSTPEWKVGENSDNELDIDFSRTEASASSFQNGNEFFRSSSKPFEFINTTGKVLRISIWGQKQRLRVYVNETKLLDLPRITPKDLSFDRIEFVSGDGEQNTYVNDVRIAVGLPDTRSKLLTEGKFVTHGITFDSGSDKIKPESFGVLKEIASVLQENPNVKIKIVGHTDSDGNDTFNLKLSQKRSLAVKNFLSKDLGIDGGRMITDGKGESQPVSSNDTAEGKANNRRVEFIKI